MTRFLYFFLLLQAFNLSAQVHCLPMPGGIISSDEPPGCLLCGLLYHGTTSGYTPDSVDYDFPCGMIENSQWLSFMSAQTGSISISIWASDCQLNKGVEFAIYDKNLNIVSNCFSSGGNELSGEISASGLIPNEIHYIMIDGYEGDICDFFMSISSSIMHLMPPSPLFISIFPSSTTPCPGDTICFTTQSPPDGVEIDWIAPENSRIISGGRPDQNLMCVEFFKNGLGILEITPRNACSSGFTSTISFEVSPEIHLYPITLCPDESIEIGSIQYSSNTITDIIYPLAASSGCDSILRLDLTISDTTPTEIICTIDSFLNALTFEWIEPDGAEEYELFINDSLVAQQSHNTYIFQPENGTDSTKIELLPKNSRGCNFQRTEMVCANPKLSSAKKLLKEELKIFPNPTKNTIRIESDLKIEGIQVFDFSGKEILFSKEKKIDLSSFSTGVYILKIWSKNQTFIRKVIKL